MPRPTQADLVAAEGKTLPDIIAPGLDVLFCGINPGLYTAAVQQHFGRPGNRFWPALHRAGFTPHLFHPSEQQHLLKLGYGITNVVARSHDPFLSPSHRASPSAQREAGHWP
jgi:TDG/mug DNA glycosylase family protein